MAGETDVGRGDPQRSLELLWRHHRAGDGRPSRGPKPALSVDRIVEAAVAIADADGLEAVSMRRIAEELGAGTMSLYRHVPGKAELLELMLDHVIGEAPNPGPEVVGWRDRLAFCARAAREHHRRHPWTLNVTMSRPPLGPNLMRSVESLMDAAAGTGLPAKEWIVITQLVGSFVGGWSRYELGEVAATQATGQDDEAWWGARMTFWETYFVPEDHPTITRAWESGAMEEVVDEFEFGLACLLDGLAARIAAHEARAGTAAD
ncbi:TetR/AcrR family transcriptional regulator [Conexibacter sp. SYSU D00693]|uniref:TetR/AcrR family transcriptional regulator n=1 Tax=Conexibacter sp. SYSU D00693 TaxID=2812560 RepID=UPI00196A97A6|nr:TetR/AcrR family transcriptional regulator C-terminal domain-containing protein [Conexibacter sp. SYSU D00693]